MSASTAAFALIAALIGAGFASGREIERFFARFGAWGLIFALLCAVELYLLSRALMRACHRYKARSLPALCACIARRPLCICCEILLVLLLCTSAGAMLCAGGELFALVFPLYAAYALGFCLTLALGVGCALGSLQALGTLGSLLAPLMAALLVCLYRLEPINAIMASPPPSPIIGLPLVLCYAPLNLVLSGGIICEAGATLTPRECDKAARSFALGIAFLLVLGVGVLARHRAQIGSVALPFVVLCARLGKFGFYACALMLYLAVLSTLTALLRALYGLVPTSPTQKRASASEPLSSISAPCAHGPNYAPYTPKKQRAGHALLTLACTLCALVGFERLIGAAYPLLGAASALLMLVLLIRARHVSTSGR